MERIKKIIVSINLNNTIKEVGELVTDNNKIYFKYYSSFIETGLEISPYKMKLANEILAPSTNIFEGLFGVFSDSLPDGWGRLLLDRTLISKGVLLNEIAPLDRLVYVGSSGMGALMYSPEIHSEYKTNKLLELDTIEKEMTNVLEGTPTKIIEELYNLGGSSGGARPKIFVGYNSKTNHLMHGKTVLPKDYNHWIIKFPTSTDLKDIANIEHAYYKMALDAGLEMSESKLFTTDSGAQYFGTKRFDRIHNERLHLHSVSGLLHDNFRYSNLDYGNIMDAAFTLERNIEAYSKVLRLAAFNVYSHNRDDHSKNISFLMNGKGDWKLAPVYDLTYSSSSHGFHSTLVAGKGESPGRFELLELAENFDVNNVNTIIDTVRNVIANWKNYAQDSGVSIESMNLISNKLRTIDD